MQTHPSVIELVEAVKHFIEETAAPQLEGHARFHARVASNVLAIIMREINLGNPAETEEVGRLQSLLSESAELSADTLNKTLCEQIASGIMTKETPDLLVHLKTTAIAQLKIDQPNYSGLKVALETSK